MAVYGHTDLKKDTLIELDGAPQRVLDYSHAAMGRGGAVARVKLKNLLTGAVTERTFRSADKIPSAEVERRTMQLLYREGNNLEFMNQETYEQESVPSDIVGEQSKFLADGSSVQLLFYNNRIIGAEVANNVMLAVTQTEPGARGDTATAALKPATVETGVQVMVPLFINEGDVIKVDTRDGRYLERQK
jgi:elongation factor P